MVGLLATIVLGAAMVAPAKAPPAKTSPATTTAASDVAQARRLYSIGEQALADGRAPQAVSLWRRAIVLLPAHADYDALRHKLVLRLGYGMLMASAQTGERAFAVDGAKMLDRYVARHEQLFGDGEDAERERGEVYELLYELETRLEATPAPEPEPTAPGVADPGAPDIAPRKVVVPGKRKLARPSIDDPKIRAKLASRATNVETGLIFAMMPTGPLHAPRGAVRVPGLVRATDAKLDPKAQRELHVRVRAAFVAVRPALRACYDAAFARTPTEAVLTEAELVLEPDGSVSAAEIVGMPLVDDRGSACVRERLADMQVDGLPMKTRIRVRLPLVFFWQTAPEAAGPAGEQYPMTMPPIEGHDFPSTRTQPLTW